jgi:hypothetical protein
MDRHQHEARLEDALSGETVTAASRVAGMRGSNGGNAVSAPPAAGLDCAQSILPAVSAVGGPGASGCTGDTAPILVVLPLSGRSGIRWREWVAVCDAIAAESDDRLFPIHLIEIRLAIERAA